jgi:predicted nuclease of restriction endonuclease-like (RecB) superfamily
MRKNHAPVSDINKIVEDDDAIGTLLERVRSLIQAARKSAARAVNSLQVVTNFEIGRMIVEQEQKGAQRAEYGKRILKELSLRLTQEFGQGFSRSNLEYMRKFYRTYGERLIEKSQTPSGKLLSASHARISTEKSGDRTEIEAVSRQEAPPFRLSWSQYVFLMSIGNAEERSFYEIEAIDNNWTLPDLKRQFNSGLYERLALSRDRDDLHKLAQKGQIVAKPQDVIKDPYVLEFLGLDEKTKYSESDLETSIIDKLEHFLLELGKGFLFEARQKRFTFDEDHFFVDLVFYNRLLRCYVLIDLKIGKLAHQDLGQMQMYVNYFDRCVKRADENPTVGIILSKKKHDALVEMTLPKEANIYASQYQLYLPSKEDLRQRLMAWAEEAALHEP